MNSWYSELSLMSNKSSSVLWQKVEFSRKEVGCVNILMWGWLYSISKDGTAKDVAHWCSTESRCKCCSYFICCVWSCFFTVSDFSIELKILCFKQLLLIKWFLIKTWQVVFYMLQISKKIIFWCYSVALLTSTRFGSNQF